MYIIGVFLNPEVRTGGHRRYLEFFQSVADKGHDVSLILNKELDYNFNSINEIRIKTNSKKIIPYSISFFRYVKKQTILHKKELQKCDYIVIHGETHLLSGIYLKKLLNSKLLFALRSNGVVEAQMKKREPKTSLSSIFKLTILEYKYRIFEKIISRYSDLIAFQSEFDKDSFLSRNKNISGRPIIISGNIGGDWFAPEYKDKNKSTNIKSLIFLGALNRRKGVGYLIDALIKLNTNGYNLKLIILGIGTLKDEMLKKLSDNNQLSSVSFEGRVNNPLHYVASSDLTIVPSVFDSFPDVILESLHVGTPVIAAESGGMPYMLDREDIFKVADSDAIYNIVKKLIDKPDEYNKAKIRVLNNRKRFNFDWAGAFLDEMCYE